MPEYSKRGELRARLLLARQSVSDCARRHADAALTAHVRTYLEQQFGALSNLNVSAYLPFQSEPDLSAIFAEIGQLSLPSVRDPAGPLTFLRYTPGMALVAQRFNVLVPKVEDIIDPDILLIPCVGFHKRRGGGFDRLGYGGGFYDRTLSLRTGVHAIGVAYAVSAIEEFDAKDHDRALEMVITELGPMR